MDSKLRRLITLGREHYNAGEYDKAEKYLSQVVAEHQGFADIYNMLGVIFHGRGDFSKAQGAFEEALRINQNYTEAALNLAVTYNDLGRYSDARDVYMRTIAKTRSESRSLDPFARGKLANMHADLGAAYAGVSLYPEAVREYQKALDLCPTFVDLRTRLAALYRDMGRVDEALRELEIVKTTNPKYAAGRVALGITLYAAGRRNDAFREWKAALSMDPDDKRAKAYLDMFQNAGTDGAAPSGLAQSDVSGILDGVDKP